jgi:hypothetical protein
MQMAMRTFYWRQLSKELALFPCQLVHGCMSELYFQISQYPNETPKISVNAKYSKVEAPPI